MQSVNELITQLGYDQSDHYYAIDTSNPKLEVRHLLRVARKLRKDEGTIVGVYTFNTQPSTFSVKGNIQLGLRPAVYVAKAQTAEQARKIHRSLWNDGRAPFLIVSLPNQVRIYTGFNYGANETIGLLVEGIQIDDLSAANIDSGRIWETQQNTLDPRNRVDTRLLRYLKQLGTDLRKSGLEDLHLAHALIGKYIYISYLRHRDILTDKWLQKRNLRIAEVLSRDATVYKLRQLDKLLEEQFNGQIFPIEPRSWSKVSDSHVQLIASVFNGDQPLGNGISQLHLDFEAFDFQYIPVETLSSIYEQFLNSQDEGREIGAVYTPESLADYLIEEVNVVKPLTRGMRILDPSCGSGIFLSLIYRRLIENELWGKNNRTLKPTELRAILLESIFGIEREPDACHIAEFSLLLTMLDYIEPPYLHKNEHFKFPTLHDRNVFEADFFDEESLATKHRGTFDWVIGNPPWIKPNRTKHGEHFVQAWIEANKTTKPVDGFGVAEAFAWRSSEFLANNGVAGLVLHAKSLFNHRSKAFRKSFFLGHKVQKVTNFANIRRYLFNGRAIAPAITIVFQQNRAGQTGGSILHFAPFAVNQVPIRNAKKKFSWVITVNENEIQVIPNHRIETGRSDAWKYAMWGTDRDLRAMERLRTIFPSTLGNLVKSKKWILEQGIELRKINEEPNLVHTPELANKLILNIKQLNRSRIRFHIPQDSLDKISPEMCYLRRGCPRWEQSHLVISASWSYVIYADTNFQMPPRQIGLYAQESDADYLRALSVFLSSSLAKYYIFFQVPDLGIERDRITLKEVRNIPVPNFTPKQIEQLAKLQMRLAEMEMAGDKTTQIFDELDTKVVQVLGVPASIANLAHEFVALRFPLNDGNTRGDSVNLPSRIALVNYGQEIRDELDAFVSDAGFHHNVTIARGKDLTICTINIVQTQERFDVVVTDQPDKSGVNLSKVKELLKDKHSQWVYVQRGLRIFSGPVANIYKSSRLIDWSRTQALNDADDMIAEILNTGERWGG